MSKKNKKTAPEVETENTMVPNIVETTEATKEVAEFTEETQNLLDTEASERHMAKLEGAVQLYETPEDMAATAALLKSLEDLEEEAETQAALNELVLASNEITLLSDKSFMVRNSKYTFDSKSKMFVELYKRGWNIGEIAKRTSSHYSFVYGVIDGKVGIKRQETHSKSDEIRTLADQGLTPGQIAKELNSNYSYVHTVVKKYKADQAKEIMDAVEALAQ